MPRSAAPRSRCEEAVGRLHPGGDQLQVNIAEHEILVASRDLLQRGLHLGAVVLKRPRLDPRADPVVLTCRDRRVTEPVGAAALELAAAPAWARCVSGRLAHCSHATAASRWNERQRLQRRGSRSVTSGLLCDAITGDCRLVANVLTGACDTIPAMPQRSHARCEDDRRRFVADPDMLAALDLTFEQFSDPDVRSVVIRHEHPEFEQALKEGRRQIEGSDGPTKPRLIPIPFS